MAEALAKIQKAQDEQKAMQAMEEAEDDDMDLVADMLMEISDLLSQAAELSARLRRSLTRGYRSGLFSSLLCDGGVLR